MEDEELSIWAPLERAALEALLQEQQYTTLHLHLLYWLTWLPLLSNDELLRLFAAEERGREKKRIATKKDLYEQVNQMANLGLVDHIVLHEPGIVRHHRYYSTDLGLYLYVSAVHPSPPLTVAQLARAYPVERDDLLKRLTRPQLHLTLSELVTRVLAEGDERGYPLLSYQQPWQHLYDLPHKKQVLRMDAALLIGHPSGTKHAFFVHVDTGIRKEWEEEQFLNELFELRRRNQLYRQSWPGLLLITTRERLSTWERLLMNTSRHQRTLPLAGGMTTAKSLIHGVYTPIWWDISQIPLLHNDTEYVLRVPLHHLLSEPAPQEVDEQFSQQARFHQLLIEEAALPPPRTKQHLMRYVGASLQYEAAHLTADRLEDLMLAAKKKDHQSLEGTGLLTLALTPMQKELLSWIARHPLLDVPVLLAVMRPDADSKDIKRIQRQITQLFQLRLVETLTWPKKADLPEQVGYILAATALRSLAIRDDKPYSYFFTRRAQEDDTPQFRQLGVHGLYAEHQREHTTDLYHFMGELFRTTHAKGEHILEWKSAHEASREYDDLYQRDNERRKIRPDAELVIAPPDMSRHLRIYLEYDRGTTDERDYLRKFAAYASYEIAMHRPLPLIVVVTPNTKAESKMQHVLSDIRGLHGPLRVVIVLERDLLQQGLNAIFHRFP